jgi:hypothetical protein
VTFFARSATLATSAFASYTFLVSAAVLARIVL